MAQQDPNDRRRRADEQRMPSWAGYLLIAIDVVRLPLFLVPWLGTVVALAMTWPIRNPWLIAAVVVVASSMTLFAVVRAVVGQVARQGALGAYVARLATDTHFGRWLTDLVTQSRD